MNQDVLALLRCPSCHSTLTAASGNGADADAIACTRCGLRIPVVGGVARFVEIADHLEARRTQESFGYEWTHFNDWRQSGETNFRGYFEGIELPSLRGRLVLDAGCGMGRHARQVAPFAGRVVAVDFSRAIDQAARNTAEAGNVVCVQADLLALPFPDEAFDFVYSLGVLHHLSETERALAGLTAKLKPGGRLRVYLYWKKHGWQGRLLTAVTLARRMTTKLPFRLLRALCWILSLGLYAALVLPYRLLSRAGVRRHERWPLFVYTKYPFNVLYNDQFDRFSAPIEKRYDADEVRRLLESSGLEDVRVRSCFGWIADGVKPAREDGTSRRVR
jgi:SAM-dependent methyltransferase